MERFVSYWVERAENLPIHNLNPLAQVAGIENDLDAEQFKFLAELTPYCIEARYGDYGESLSEIINEQRAREVYAQTKEIFKWLYQKIDRSFTIYY